MAARIQPVSPAKCKVAAFPFVLRAAYFCHGLTREASRRRARYASSSQASGGLRIGRTRRSHVSFTHLSQYFNSRRETTARSSSSSALSPSPWSPSPSALISSPSTTSGEVSALPSHDAVYRLLNTLSHSGQLHRSWYHRCGHGQRRSLRLRLRRDSRGHHRAG